MKKGDKVIIRDACNFIHIGEVARITRSKVTLTSASWVADTGRYGEFLKTGKLSESEFIGTVGLGRGAIVQDYPWPTGVELPTSTK
jgi:hypothetical protein